MIFTERTVTIRAGASSMGEKVILYRGDRKVEIRFTIKDSKFKFQNTGNIISNTNAAYAQLAILNPNGSNLFTEITPTDNGTVLFEITGEMIDGLEEVGLYSFHIRLFDEENESRITLPEVIDGIEIREPMIIEPDGIILPDGATYITDVRYIATATSPQERDGFVSVKLPISTNGTSTYEINISNLPNPTIEFNNNAIYSESESMGIDYVNPESLTSFVRLNSATDCSFTPGDDRKSGTITCKPSAVCEYILLSFLVVAGNSIATIGESILDGIVVTLEQKIQ